MNINSAGTESVTFQMRSFVDGKVKKRYPCNCKHCRGFFMSFSKGSAVCPSCKNGNCQKA